MSSSANLELSDQDSLWLSKDRTHFLSRTRIALLEKIHELGSLSKAARAVRISYRTAWNAVDNMNRLSGDPLVLTATGGKHGGGSKLTSKGKELIQVYSVVEGEHEQFIHDLSRRIHDFDTYYRLIRKISMKVSSRNQFFGTIRKVKKGSVNSEIEIGIDQRTRIIAVITNESVEDLGLKRGMEAYALIKANMVIVACGMEGIKTSARNQLDGKVSRIVPGPVSAEVVIEFAPGKTVTAVITRESLRELSLKQGTEASAIFKASSVIVGVRG